MNGNSRGLRAASCARVIPTNDSSYGSTTLVTAISQASTPPITMPRPSRKSQNQLSPSHSAEKRRGLERQIRDVAAEYATQATLSPTGATEQEMSRAIEGGIRDIGKIFGVKS